MNPAQPTPAPASWQELLEARGSSRVADAVDGALRELGDKKDSLSARLGFAKLGRQLGSAEPEADIVARTAYVVGLAERIAPADLPDLLTTLYRTGSEREQVSVLRALPFLPGGERLVGLAREASRTNDVNVFSALACDSAFPARFLPDPALGQLVLKALFLGVSVRRIADLETRVTPELKRMISDFESERSAAGRPVPADVLWLLELPSTASDLT